MTLYRMRLCRSGTSTTLAPSKSVLPELIHFHFYTDLNRDHLFYIRRNTPFTQFRQNQI